MLEHGITFGEATDGAFNLNAPISGRVLDASVRGTQMVLRSLMSYSAASRSAGGGQRAFVDATKHLVENMYQSMAKALEIELMYGQVGLGTVASVSTNDVVITAAEWAAGIWSGAEQMPVEVRTSGGTLRGHANVQSVNLSTRTITLDAAPASTGAGDIIWRKGAYGKEFAGVHKILTNTGSLFGIDASQYGLWQASAYAPGSASTLSFAIIQAAVAKAVEKGLDGKVMVLVNPGHWDDLMTEQAAFRMFDSSYSPAKAENGAKTIKFHGQNGEMEIVSSIYCKQGYAYVLSKDDFVRIGSTDITFETPGRGDEFFIQSVDAAGFELRAYTDQALFCDRPGKNVIISNITI